jgi:hypothetical protein
MKDGDTPTNQAVLYLLITAAISLMLAARDQSDEEEE